MKRSVTMMMCEMCMGMMSMCMFRRDQKSHQLSDICLKKKKSRCVNKQREGRMTAPLFLFCAAVPAGRRC